MTFQEYIPRLNFINSQLTAEQVGRTLPQLELDAMQSGSYYMNLHIITGRKPRQPRPGDLLLDGTRQEMTTATYDAMARFTDIHSTQWKRHMKYNRPCLS
jgi:hypothetical protein